MNAYEHWRLTERIVYVDREDLGLSVYTQRALMRNGIATLNHARELGDRLAGLTFVGKTAQKQVQEAIDRTIGRMPTWEDK